MTTYCQISYRERLRIYRGMLAGRSVSELAEELGRHRSTIYREIGEELGQARRDLEPEGVRRFFGDEDGDELQMCLNFNLNQVMALSIVREDAGRIIHSLKGLPSLPADSHRANFVRNHDEWSLDKLTESERRDAFALFGPKKDMQLFGRGVPCRLRSMLGNDQARMHRATDGSAS